MSAPPTVKSCSRNARRSSGPCKPSGPGGHDGHSHAVRIMPAGNGNSATLRPSTRRRRWRWTSTSCFAFRCGLWRRGIRGAWARIRPWVSRCWITHLAAGKLAALLARHASRDLFDAGGAAQRGIGLGQVTPGLRRVRHRAGIERTGARCRMEDVKFDAAELMNELLPVLRAADAEHLANPAASAARIMTMPAGLECGPPVHEPRAGIPGLRSRPRGNRADAADQRS